MTNFATVIIFFLFYGLSAQGQVCAKNFSDLDKTERLQNLKKILPDSERRGFVNKTRGSYFDIYQKENQFIISFYTTGLFDLYGIHREGPVEFCDDQSKITVTGLGRIKTIHIDGKLLSFDDGADNKAFTPGEMPEPLREINNLPKK